MPDTPSQQPQPMLGNFKIVAPQQGEQRMSILLWGTSGCGKTTLAATAPGEKLWIQFDNDGTSVINSRPDVHVVDLSKEPDNVVLKFREKDPLGLDKYLEAHPEIETVVIDSVTSFGEKAMPVAVEQAQGTLKGRDSTLEDPGYAGHGNKNTWVRKLVMGILRITGKHQRHIIIICHEDKPSTDKQGNVMHISMMLGSSLVEQVPINLSEVWFLSDNGRKRFIAVRPVALRKPMKTRMFLLAKPPHKPQFEWIFNADDWTGDGIATWFNAWKANGFAKIPLPNSNG